MRGGRGGSISVYGALVAKSQMTRRRVTGMWLSARVSAGLVQIAMWPPESRAVAPV